jgi:glycosyltransferase involved in cell wall biosynthesis
VRAARILFVNRFFYPDFSATAQLLWDLARHLAAEGHSVHVFCSRQLYENAAAHLPAREVVSGVHIHRLWTSRFGRKSLLGRALDYASFYWSVTWSLLRWVRPKDVLIVKTDPPLMSIPARWIAAARGAIQVNWLQDVFPEVAMGLGMASRLRLLQSLRDRSLRGSAMNVVLGSRMRDYFVARGIPSDRLRIIENWSDGESLKGSSLRRSLGLDQRFVVQYSGNLGRAHEIETLFSAAEQLRDEPEFVFLMIGGGAKMLELETRARERRLESFLFLPYRSREALPDSLAAADVHLISLLPSLEGFIVPSKLYGVLAAGRPSIFIGDAEGEVARILREAGCGIHAPCGDGERLAQTLRSLSAHPERLESMGLKARAYFETHCTFNAAASRWTSLLKELTQDSGLSTATSSLARTKESRKLSIVRR